MNLGARAQFSEKDYSMVAIELKLCLVVATVADFKERQRADDVNQDQAKAASMPSRALPAGTAGKWKRSKKAASVFGG
jgi:hypothetical protein